MTKERQPRTTSTKCTQNYHKWMVLSTAYVAIALALGFYYSQGPLFVIVMRRFGSSRAETALIQSLCNAMIMGPGVFFGMLVHKIGTRKAAMIGALIVTSSMVTSAFATSVTYLICTAILFGAGLSPMNLASITAVGHHFEDTSYCAIILSVHATSISVGGMLYPYFIQYLDAQYGLPGIYLIIAGLMAHTFVCALCWDKPKHQQWPNVTQVEPSIQALDADLDKEQEMTEFPEETSGDFVDKVERENESVTNTRDVPNHNPLSRDEYSKGSLNQFGNTVLSNGHIITNVSKTDIIYANEHDQVPELETISNAHQSDVSVNGDVQHGHANGKGHIHLTEHSGEHHFDVNTNPNDTSTEFEDSKDVREQLQYAGLPEFKFNVESKHNKTHTKEKNASTDKLKLSNLFIIASKEINGNTFLVNNKTIEIIVVECSTTGTNAHTPYMGQSRVYDNPVFDKTLSDEVDRESDVTKSVRWNTNPGDTVILSDVKCESDADNGQPGDNGDKGTRDKQKVTILQSLKYLVKQSYFWPYVFGIGIATPVINVLTVFVVDIFIDKGFTESDASLSLVLFNIFSCVGRISTGVYIRVLHVPPLCIPIVATIGASLGLVSLTYISSLETCLVAMSVYGYAAGLQLTTFSVTTVELFGITHFSNCAGLLLTGSSIGNAVAVPISGYIRDRTHSYTLVLLSSAVACAVSCLLFVTSHILCKAKGQQRKNLRRPSILVSSVK